MRLELVNGIRLIIISFLAYVPTVTFSGWFTAWVAKRYDDDLPERFGFLTFDPFAHFSIFGFALLLIGKFFGNYLTFFKDVPGFGRFIMLDPQPSIGKLKIIAEFFARSFAHFIMFTISTIVLMLLLKEYWLMSPEMFSKETGSFLLSSKDILAFFLGQNLVLCRIYLLFGIADCICFFWNIPRMFSMIYFGVLIATLLLLDIPVEFLFKFYISSIQTLVFGATHG